VNAAAEDFSVRARQKGLELEIEVSDGLPLIEGGANNLRRVLDNLLGNALKFTPEGGIVSLRAFEQDDRVMMQVSDTGIGIPADQLERVFERFYQVDGSARRKYGGAGLGLALVKDIVEAYGGEVLVDSEVDEGSTFTVALPRA
jgi:two-component system phosphate regulon sensor histidine kinase PhoR